MFWLNFKDLIIWDVVEVLLIVHKSAEWETLNPLELHGFCLSLQRQCQVMAASLGYNPASNQSRSHLEMKNNSLHYTVTHFYWCIYLTKNCIRSHFLWVGHWAHWPGQKRQELGVTGQSKELKSRSGPWNGKFLGVRNRMSRGRAKAYHLGLLMSMDKFLTP